jgi:hypothetical protein
MVIASPSPIPGRLNYVAGSAEGVRHGGWAGDMLVADLQGESVLIGAISQDLSTQFCILGGHGLARDFSRYNHVVLAAVVTAVFANDLISICFSPRNEVLSV